MKRRLLFAPLLMKLKPLALLLLCLLTSLTTLAQVPGQAPATQPASPGPNGLMLTGRMTDSTAQETLVGLAVQLWSLPDSTLKVAITNVEGKFEFKNLKPGLYQIKARYLGYSDLKRRVRISPEVPVRDLGVLRMSAKAEVTKEIEVIGERLAVQQKGDTTQFDASSFKVNRDASAEDLVTKMPGIQIVNGQVQAQGENVRRVLVDGKPFFGDDPNASLKNLPADVIDKVEVFDQKSEASQFSGFNDGNTNKTLNIITKAGMKHGVFGSLSGGWGKDNGELSGNDRYKFGGSINRFAGDQRLTLLLNFNNVNEQNFSIEDIVGATGGGGGGRGGFMMMRAAMGGGFGGMRGGRGGGGGGISDFLVSPSGGITTTQAVGLNFNDQWGKTSAAISYFFNRGVTDAITGINRTYFSNNDTAQVYGENNTSRSTNMNHRINGRFEYKPNDRNSILFIPRYSLQLNDGTNNVNGLTTLGDATLSRTGNNFSSNLLGYNLNNELMLRHRFEKIGRTISLNLTSVINNQDGDNTLRANNSFLRGQNLMADSTGQVGKLVKRGTTSTATLEYTEPISASMQVAGSYTISQQITDSDKQTRGDLDANRGVLFDSLSNKFRSVYTYQQGKASFLYNDEKANLTVNLAYQTAFLNNDITFPKVDATSRPFYNLLPSAFFTYKFTDLHSIRVIYNTSTNVPSVDQLQNVVNNNNPLQLSSGNPNLRQDFQHRMIVRFSMVNPKANSTFFAFVMGNLAQDYVVNATTIARMPTTLDNGVTLLPGSQFTRPINMDGFWSTVAFVNYGFPLRFIKSQVNVGANANMSNTPGMINDATNFARSNTYGGNLTLSSNISENVDFTVSARPGYNQVINTLSTAQNTNFFSQNTSARLNLVFLKGTVFNSTISYQNYSGLSDGFNQNFWLWNMSIGKRVLANDAGEIKLSVFDQLGQNQSISRTSNEAYVEDARTLVLQRYYMVSFSYRLRQFNNNAQLPPGVTPGMMQLMRPM